MAAGCPTWTWAEDVAAPRTIPGRVESGPGGRLTGHAPCAISAGTNEFPGDADPISTEVRDASVGFAGTIVDTDTGSHWYRDWRFEATLPPAPWDGRLEYGFYLFCWVHVSGESAVRAGRAPTIAFNTHLYAGLTAGEATVLGGFMPHDRAGERLDDPWPPPHAGEVRFAFEAEQVLAPT